MTITYLLPLFVNNECHGSRQIKWILNGSALSKLYHNIFFNILLIESSTCVNKAHKGCRKTKNIMTTIKYFLFHNFANPVSCEVVAVVVVESDA